ncbi:hypothetical protein FH972_004827 [Carpinus fangiana]|uniref:Legume lectin domain-containing protein n=1 Tax=Carpinus fangiana TaxID=176857 RepID=A0A5N6QMF2_9ROSI|nr:hypothetical protein FH972_004827 [Carpinus fangiana]
MAGNATISGSLIQLTPNAVDNWGRATYSEIMRLWEKSTGKLASFTNSFSFVISSEGADRYSDGLIFFLASPNFPAPIPTDGSGIGLVSRAQMRDSSFLAANKFVAVEFDTFRNDEPRWDPPEPVREHVGININDMKSRNTTTWYSVIKEKRTYNSTISYDPSTQNLSVSFTGFNSTIPIPQQLSFIVDLRDHLPEKVEFGFAAGTGFATELHILSSWSFESTAPLLNPLPQRNKNEKESKAGLVVGLSVGACVLVVGGLGLVWLINRKKKLGRGGGHEDLDFDLSMDDEFERGTGPKRFSYKELVRATNNFTGENKLGEGGFGGAKEGEIILLEWVWELYGRGQLLDAADPKLCGKFDEQQMERLMIVGLWCGHPNYNLRPPIRKALHVLDFEAPLPIDLATKMPVPTYVGPSGTTYTSSSSATTSSTASASATALLYSHTVN